MMRKFAVLVLVLTCGIWADAQLDGLKKRKAELDQMAADCAVLQDAKKTDCLADRQKKVDRYKIDLQAYKDQLSRGSANDESQDYQASIALRERSIKAFTDILAGCTEKSELCASALFQVGNLTYKKEEDTFLLEQSNYEKEYQSWEDHDRHGSEPVSPRRNHAMSLQYFQRFLKDYPNNKEAADVLAAASFVADMLGNDDLSYEYLNRLVTVWPNHPAATKAHLRLGEYWLLKRDYAKAIEQYEKVPLDLPGSESGLALYHRAEAYYNMAAFEESAKWYYEYVTRADAGKIQGDLRDEALSFMAASWADMDNGFDAASRFLSQHGNPPWENEVYFQIGQKNKAHDRLDESVKAFHFLLQRDPAFAKAPTADLSIVEIFNLQKKAEDAQKARIEMAARYVPGSPWYVKNSSNKAAMDEASKAIHLAMYQIPVYYHQKSELGDSDQSLIRKAGEGYRSYIARFPNEVSWDVFQVHQNLAIVYTKLHDYRNAAAEWRWCATANTDQMGKVPNDKKDLVSKQDAGYNAVVMVDEARKVALAGVYHNDTAAAFKGNETKLYVEYVKWFTQLYSNFPSIAEISYNAAILQYEAKNYDEAIKPLNELIQKFPDHPRAILIRRALAQSYLEGGHYDDAEKQFLILQSKLCPADTQCAGIRKSLASTMFKQAEIQNKGHDYAASTQKYQQLVRDFRDVEIADKALFEAGVNADSAGRTDEGVRLLLKIPQDYPQSTLRIKAVLKAASIYMTRQRYRDAARVFLGLQRDFPGDSLGGIQALAWAADAFEKVQDERQEAQTFESAFRLYPSNAKTPGYLYNAAQIYENSKWYPEAIGIYQLIYTNYPSSQYAPEAMFSVPLLYEKTGDVANAVTAYDAFAARYPEDKGKVMQAYFSAAKGYESLGDEKMALANYERCINLQPGSGLPPAKASEAAYRAGDVFYKKVAIVRLDGTKAQNEGRFKAMLENLTPAVQYYAKAVGFAEEEWALRATLKIGDLFSTIAVISDNQHIAGLSGEDRFRVMLDNKRTVPVYLDKAKEVYKKNLDVGLSQNLDNPWIDTTGTRLMETYAFKGRALEDLADLYLHIPLPEDAPADALKDAHDQLKKAADEQVALAVTTYREALKVAQTYSLNNPARDKIVARLQELDPKSPELKLPAPQKPASGARSDAKSPVSAQDRK